jgi:hypothetical protein
MMYGPHYMPMRRPNQPWRGDRIDSEAHSCAQGAFTDVKAEIRQVLSDHGVTKMSMRPVRRSYAFEDRAVAPGEQWVLKVKYPGNQAALPAGLRGGHSV